MRAMWILSVLVGCTTGITSKPSVKQSSFLIEEVRATEATPSDDLLVEVLDAVLAKERALTNAGKTDRLNGCVLGSLLPEQWGVDGGLPESFKARFIDYLKERFASGHELWIARSARADIRIGAFMWVVAGRLPSRWSEPLEASCPELTLAEDLKALRLDSICSLQRGAGAELVEHAKSQSAATASTLALIHLNETASYYAQFKPDCDASFPYDVPRLAVTDGRVHKTIEKAVSLHLVAWSVSERPDTLKRTALSTPTHAF